jgi:hypothetical protein
MLFDFIDDNQQHLRLVLLLVLLLQYYNNIRPRHYLLQSTIVDPKESPWRRLYKNSDDESFLNLTGLNQPAFRMLMGYIFNPEYFLHFSTIVVGSLV